MSDVNIIIRYLGEWQNHDQIHIYKGEKSKGVIISSVITYTELLDRVCDIVKIDYHTHSVEIMKYKYNVHGPMEPVTIEGDDDVNFFIRANMDRSIPTTCLCISTCERTNDFHSINSPLCANACLFDNTELNDPTSDNLDEPNFGDHIFDNPILNNSNSGGSTFEDLSEATSNSVNTSQTRGTRTSIVTNNYVKDADFTAGCVREVLQVNEVFMDKKRLYKKLCMYAMELHFQFDVIKSTKSLLVVGCCVVDCKWWLRARLVKDTSLFVIKVYRDKHLSSSCFEYHDHRQTTGWVIGQCIKSKYEGVGRIYRLNDIVKDFQKDHGITISYNKAWRARESALDSLHGSPEESFAELTSFFAQLKQKNPGTVTNIKFDVENRFKYSFMALGPSLRGFQNCIRPVICVDGTHLKGKYLGTLFVAACLDDNNQVYPLAFGVGDSENDASWKWFFEKLRGAIGSVESLVVISDRHASIDKAVHLVFNGAFHGICMYHLSQNMKVKKYSEDVLPLFYKAAKAYRETDFRSLIHQIRGFDNGKIFKYLSDTGFHKWARAFFPGDRYNIT